jgi:hypothetical protein
MSGHRLLGVHHTSGCLLERFAGEPPARPQQVGRLVPLSRLWGVPKPSSGAVGRVQPPPRCPHPDPWPRERFVARIKISHRMGGSPRAGRIWQSSAHSHTTSWAADYPSRILAAEDAMFPFSLSLFPCRCKARASQRDSRERETLTLFPGLPCPRTSPPAA